MLLNAHSVEKLISDPNKFGQRAIVGYDLSLKEVKSLRIGPDNYISREKTYLNPHLYDKIEPDCISAVITPEYKKGVEIWNLLPGTYSLVFDQGLKLPNNRTGLIIQRSSLLRCGIKIDGSIYDSGFEVENIGAMMFCWNPISIEVHARIAQLIVMENEEAEVYRGQFQGIKDIK